jgi:hypothetical protein
VTLPVPRNEEDIEEKGETCTSHMVPGELNREQDSRGYPNRTGLEQPLLNHRKFPGQVQECVSTFWGDGDLFNSTLQRAMRRRGGSESHDNRRTC